MKRGGIGSWGDILGLMSIVLSACFPLPGILIASLAIAIGNQTLWEIETGQRVPDEAPRARIARQMGWVGMALGWLSGLGWLAMLALLPRTP